MKRTTLLSAATPLAVAAAAILAVGDLNPPAGAVAATGKRLTEIEPRIPISATTTPGDADSLFKITQPGSYYLTGNVGGVINKFGIEITASGVTVDLNGFDLLGVAGSLSGVRTTVAGLSGIAVINGSIRSWGGDGIELTANNCLVRDIRASGNGAYGVYLGSSHNKVIDCTLSLNVGEGVYTFQSSTISNCSAYQNGGSGVATGGANTISNCTAFGNVIGITVLEASTVSNCTAYNNTGVGISAQTGSVISNCTASQNTGDGFSTGSNVNVSNCWAESNDGDGIRVDDGCSVIDCGTGRNMLDGIRFRGSCVIRGNVCRFNGDLGDGANIHATGSDNRIEGNNCSLADRGIDVDFAGNIIIQNTCSGNTTNWDIVANNVFGPILDRRAPASAAVLGNSAASSTGTTDPSANFTY
ncbi:MAG: right-handed parallel beta-helix repeat-containing protein [Planctomycetes bacterium]|nr:right-handed parallel beta-helix repeat-containing protein [Planctomycetota bacterium]